MTAEGGIWEERRRRMWSSRNTGRIWESTKGKGRVIGHGHFTPTKQPQARLGEQDVSNTFGVDVGRLSEGKVDQIFSGESSEVYQDPLSWSQEFKNLCPAPGVRDPFRRKYIETA